MLIGRCLLIGRVGMETNGIIARREPPAVGLAACLRSNADDV